MECSCTFASRRHNIPWAGVFEQVSVALFSKRQVRECVVHFHESHRSQGSRRNMSMDGSMKYRRQVYIPVQSRTWPEHWSLDGFRLKAASCLDDHPDIERRWFSMVKSRDARSKSKCSSCLSSKASPLLDSMAVVLALKAPPCRVWCRVSRRKLDNSSLQTLPGLVAQK